MNKLNKIVIIPLIMAGTTILNAANTQKVYASVNGKNITATDISVALKDQRVNFDTLPKDSKKQVLKQLVQKTLLSNKAMKSDVVNTKFYKDTLNAAIQNMKEELALQIWMQKISKTIKISDDEIKKFYNDNKFRFIKPLELKASHILVKTKEEALKIIKQLKNIKNKKDLFTKLAKEKSTGPSGKNGGELGWFTTDKMVPEFSKATEKLNIGEITTSPVKTQFGYHIIYLDDKKEKGTIELKDATNQIKAVLSQDKFKAKLDSIVKEEESKATIVYK